MLGLAFTARVENEQLVYQSTAYIIKLGKTLIRLPEWMVLGKANILEKPVDETHFFMDFRLIHPLFGEVFRYAGTFRVQKF